MRGMTIHHTQPGAFAAASFSAAEMASAPSGYLRSRGEPSGEKLFRPVGALDQGVYPAEFRTNLIALFLVCLHGYGAEYFYLRPGGSMSGAPGCLQDVAVQTHLTG